MNLPCAATWRLPRRCRRCWKTTPARDTEGREKLWQAVQIVGKVKSHLEAVAANGRLAERQIAEIAARPKRFGIV